MPNFLVVLDFAVNLEQCKQAQALPAKATPEAIVGQAGNMSYEVMQEGVGGMRQYRVEASIDAANGDAAGSMVVALFEHLPSYDTICCEVEDTSVDGDGDPTDAEGETKSAFRVNVVFRSGVPFGTLQAGFKEHIADGTLVGNGNKSCEYVAYVGIGAVTSEGVKDAVHSLLKRAFGAEAPESDMNFQPIKTTLL